MTLARAEDANRILSDMEASALARLKADDKRFGRQARVTLSRVLSNLICLQGGSRYKIGEQYELDLGTWAKAKKNGWLSPQRFRDFNAKCEAERQSEFEERWNCYYDLRGYRPYLNRNGLTQGWFLDRSILSLGHQFKDGQSEWYNVACDLIDLRGLDPRILNTDELNTALEMLVFEERTTIGEAHALRNAFILMQATYAKAMEGRLSNLRAFVASACAVIDLSSITGQLRVMQRAGRLISEISKTYDDPYLTWLRIDALANYKEGLAIPNEKSLNNARILFSTGYNLAVLIPRKGANASEWPALSRAPVGTFFNHLNVQVKRGMGYAEFKAELDLMNCGILAFGEHVRRNEKIMSPMMGNMYVSELFINLHLNNARVSHSGKSRMAEAALEEIEAIGLENGGLDQLPMSRQIMLRRLRREAIALMRSRP